MALLLPTSFVVVATLSQGVSAVIQTHLPSITSTSDNISRIGTMNWTGGSLQRTKKANQGLTQRQRAYFAKSRGQPQHLPMLSVAPSHLPSDSNDTRTKTTKHDQALEANRKKLLNQRDWLGINPLEPFKLPSFLSQTHRNGIGKRRKPRGGRGAIVRQNEVDNFAKHMPRTTGAILKMTEHDWKKKNDVQDIRIQIGTDASTNTHSPGTPAYLQSSPEALSEPMLFDQDGNPYQERIGDLSRARETDRETKSAVSSQNGHMRRAGGRQERKDIDQFSPSSAIVDAEPWRYFPTECVRQSSQSVAFIATGNGLLHSHPTAQDNEAVPTWSQHATQGKRTHLSSSCISSSLPSLWKSGMQRAPKQNVSESRNRSNYPTKGDRLNRDSEEELWRKFVVGVSSSSLSDFCGDLGLDNEDNVTKPAMP